jgi:aldose 1-epimerase
MPFTVSTRSVSAGGTQDTAYILADSAGTVRAEVWPAFGFNCLQWQLRQVSGTWADLLYKDPTWEQNPVPTRSGHPILFPFPNRLKNGHFSHQGQKFQLPLNESSGTHAIHGFTPKNPWRVIGATGGPDFAEITGEFQLSRDRPEARGFWPADFLLIVTYQLRANSLSVHCQVENPDATTLPFGLGYHPYFVCANAPGAQADDMLLQAATSQQWEAEAGIPTGVRKPAAGEYDFRTPRRLGTIQLDTLYTREVNHDFEGIRPELARLRHATAPGELIVLADPAFRELLLFTPPHRQAVAIEPYTCVTDAANRTDAGWRVLPAGGEFSASVEYVWQPG